jgi:hypothetical protein
MITITGWYASLYPFLQVDHLVLLGELELPLDLVCLMHVLGAVIFQLTETLSGKSITFLTAAAVHTTGK